MRLSYRGQAALVVHPPLNTHLSTPIDAVVISRLSQGYRSNLVQTSLRDDPREGHKKHSLSHKYTLGGPSPIRCQKGFVEKLFSFILSTVHESGGHGRASRERESRKE